MRLGPYHLVLSNEQHDGARERQEDYFGFWFDEEKEGPAKGAVIILADGMGGLAGGDAASVLAVNAFVQSLSNSVGSPNTRRRLEAAARLANREVHTAAQRADADIGSTLVALFLTPTTYQFLSIGDSVLYMRRGDRVVRLNHDHNLGARLDRQLAAGEITPEEANEKAGQRAYLTSNLGLEEIAEIELSDPEELQPGDQFVLASDGLSDTLPFESIRDVILQTDPESAAPLLVRDTMARANPRQDNTTVVSVVLKEPTKSAILDRKTLFLGSFVAVVLALLAAGGLVVPKLLKKGAELVPTDEPGDTALPSSEVPDGAVPDTTVPDAMLTEDPVGNVEEPTQAQVEDEDEPTAPDEVVSGEAPGTDGGIQSPQTDAGEPAPVQPPTEAAPEPTEPEAAQGGDQGTQAGGGEEAAALPEAEEAAASSDPAAGGDHAASEVNVPQAQAETEVESATEPASASPTHEDPREAEREARRAELERWKTSALRELAEGYGLSTAVGQKVLINRILDHEFPPTVE